MTHVSSARCFPGRHYQPIAEQTESFDGCRWNLPTGLLNNTGFRHVEAFVELSTLSFFVGL